MPCQSARVENAREKKCPDKFGALQMPYQFARVENARESEVASSFGLTDFFTSRLSLQPCIALVSDLQFFISWYH